MNRARNDYFKCRRCGKTFVIGDTHSCYGQEVTTQPIYAPNVSPPGAGARPLRQLTEDDVRRIVREEMGKATEAGGEKI